MGLGHARDLLRLQEPPAQTYIQLDDLRRLLVEDLGELILGGQALARRNGDARVRCHPGHLIHVLWWHWLLKPERAVFFQRLRDPDGGVRGELPVRPNGDFQFVSDCGAHILEDLCHALDRAQAEIPGARRVRGEEIKLAGCVPLLDQFNRYLPCLFGRLPDTPCGHIGIRSKLLVESAAQQIVYGLIQGFANNVPASHLDGAHSRGIGHTGVPVIVASTVHSLPQQFNVKRVLTDNEFLRQVLNHFDVHVHPRPGVHGTLAETHESLVCSQFDEKPAAPPAIGTLVPDHNCLDIDDFHLRTS